MYEKYLKYYLIPTDNRLEKSLIKIIQDKKFIKNVPFDFLYEHEKIVRRFLYNKHIYKHKFIFICLYKYNNKNDNKFVEWAWNPYRDSLMDTLFEEKNATFKGCVNFEEFELTANKYNL